MAPEGEAVAATIVTSLEQRPAFGQPAGGGIIRTTWLAPPQAARRGKRGRRIVAATAFGLQTGGGIIAGVLYGLAPTMSTESPVV